MSEPMTGMLREVRGSLGQYDRRTARPIDDRHQHPRRPQRHAVMGIEAVDLCGDARHMAKDVEAAILQVIQNAGDKTVDEAKDYLKQLQKKQRFLKDVY